MAKTNKPNSNKQPKQAEDKTKNILAIGAALLFLAAVFIGIRLQQSAVERRTFKDGEQRITRFKELVPNKLQLPVVFTEDKSCYRANQSIASKGELFCDITLNGTYTVNNDDEALSTQAQIVELAKSSDIFGPNAPDYGSGSVSFGRNKDGLGCSIVFTHSKSNSSSSLEKVEANFAASCSKPAVTAVYPATN